MDHVDDVLQMGCSPAVVYLSCCCFPAAAAVSRLSAAAESAAVGMCGQS